MVQAGAFCTMMSPHSAFLKRKDDQFHRLVQAHEEARHVGVGDGDGFAGLNLFNEQRNY